VVSLKFRGSGAGVRGIRVLLSRFSSERTVEHGAGRTWRWAATRRRPEPSEAPHPIRRAGVVGGSVVSRAFSARNGYGLGDPGLAPHCDSVWMTNTPWPCSADFQYAWGGGDEAHSECQERVRFGCQCRPEACATADRRSALRPKGNGCHSYLMAAGRVPWYEGRRWRQEPGRLTIASRRFLEFGSTSRSESGWTLEAWRHYGDTTTR
jgi:hypothetical protein